jgi:hypothetical protein
LTVMSVTAVTVDVCCRWRSDHGPADPVVE